MKRIGTTLLAAALLLAACNNNKPKEATYVSTDGKEKVSVDVNQMTNAMQEYQKKTEELQKLTPYSLDELKAMIPESLSGAARKSFEVNSAMGVSTANARYAVNDSTSIHVEIMDCAGAAGAGIYSLQFLGMMNMQRETEDEYSKTIDFNGGRAIESCQKNRVECKLTFFTKDRLLVNLEGENVNADGLKQAAKELKL